MGILTKSNLSQVPDRYIRKQTLTNCERYITEELKNMEEEILGGQDKLINLEYEVFLSIRENLGKYFYSETESKPMIIAVIQEI